MNDDIKKNFLFLSFAIPDNEMKKVFNYDKFPSIQTHKFNWNFIKGIINSGQHDYTLVSTRAVSDYPSYPNKIIRSKIWKNNINNHEFKIQEIAFINSSILKLCTRFFSSLYYSIKSFHKIKNKEGVIVYSVHVPYLLTGLIISKLYKIDFIAIWTDPPAISNSNDSILKSSLRKIEIHISRIIMKKVSKAIVLTKYLAEDYAPKKPYLVVEGILDDNELDRSAKDYNTKDNIIIVYTGSLEKRYGIESLIKGFMQLDKENVYLEIYGRGDYENELLEVCKKNIRIKYGGFINNNNEVLNIQKNADFLINTRPINEEYVKYSFPSKTLEYLMSGTPVITTFLPGMPEEYEMYLLKLNDNKPNTIFDALTKAINLTPEERELIGTNAKEFVKMKDFKIQGQRISKFLDKRNF